MEAITATTMTMMTMAAIMMTMMMTVATPVAFALNVITSPRIAAKVTTARLMNATMATAFTPPSTVTMAIHAPLTFALADTASIPAPAVLLTLTAVTMMFAPLILARAVHAFTLRKIAMIVMPVPKMSVTAIPITVTLPQGASTSRWIAGMVMYAQRIIATAPERASVIRLPDAAPQMPIVMMVTPAPLINAVITSAGIHQRQSVFRLKGIRISARAMA